MDTSPNVKELQSKLDQITTLYGNDLKKLKKHDRFRQAMEIFRDVIATGSATNIAYTYGPRALEYATNVMNNVIQYGGDVVEAVQYLNNPENYLVSVTEDDYVPIAEDDPLFELELETGDVLLPAEETVVGGAEEAVVGAEETGGFFESVFSNAWDGFVDTVEGGYGAVESAYESGGVVEAVETGIETVYEAVTAAEVLADTAEVIAGMFFL